MSSGNSTFDFIVVGGGLCGCVVASRLKQAFPSQSIAVFEAGIDSRDQSIFNTFADALTLLDPQYRSTYDTVPQKHLNNRQIQLDTGRALGGSSAVNYGGWTRGHRSGYDEWAALVGDHRWSYDALLPFFKMSENWSVPGENAQHGYGGPINATVVERNYPLKEPLRQAYLEAGMNANSDMNSGEPTGFAPLSETWSRGQRSFAARNYPLDGVDLFTNSPVSSLVIEGKTVSGIKLSDGRVFHVTKEIIVSTGALKTPQLLMLSGIGPVEELREHNIPTILDVPDVGKGLHDHPFLPVRFRLRHPEQGLALGSPKFNDPSFFEGNFSNFVAIGKMSDEDQKRASNGDAQTYPRQDDFENIGSYMSFPTAGEPPSPPDGTAVTMTLCGLTVTSRGSVTLSSADPQDKPVIDLAYMSTEHDRSMMRAGVRKILEIAATPAGKSFLLSEDPGKNGKPLHEKSSDEEIDERVKATTVTTYHYAGTASMGKVVDTDCKVKGLQGLRVVDASILPVSLGAHLQAPLYGIAERAAVMIIESHTE